MTVRTVTTATNLLTEKMLRRRGACESAIQLFISEFGHDKARTGVTFGCVLAHIAECSELTLRERMSYMFWLAQEFAASEKAAACLYNACAKTAKRKSGLCREALLRAAREGALALTEPCKKQRHPVPDLKQFKYDTLKHGILGELRDHLEFMSANLSMGADHRWVTCLLSYVEVHLFGSGDYVVDDLLDLLARDDIDSDKLSRLTIAGLKKLGRKLAPMLSSCTGET